MERVANRLNTRRAKRRGEAMRAAKLTPTHIPLNSKTPNECLFLKIKLENSRLFNQSFLLRKKKIIILDLTPKNDNIIIFIIISECCQF